VPAAVLGGQRGWVGGTAGTSALRAGWRECLLDMKKQKLCRLSAIGWDGRHALDREAELASFVRIKKPDEEAPRTAGAHLVRYTGLDKSDCTNER